MIEQILISPVELGDAGPGAGPADLARLPRQLGSDGRRAEGRHLLPGRPGTPDHGAMAIDYLRRGSLLPDAPDVRQQSFGFAGGPPQSRRVGIQRRPRQPDRRPPP